MTESASSAYCTFYLGGFLFGIELLRVQEVVREAEVTPVPLAPAIVMGLINLRGQIITALDLRQRLHLGSRPSATAAMNVVVSTRGGPVSLVVDDIGDVVEDEENNFEPPPETIPADLRSMILGVYKLERRLMHVLDSEKVCALDQ